MTEFSDCSTCPQKGCHEQTDSDLELEARILRVAEIGGYVRHREEIFEFEELQSRKVLARQSRSQNGVRFSRHVETACQIRRRRFGRLEAPES